MTVPHRLRLWTEATVAAEEDAETVVVAAVSGGHIAIMAYTIAPAQGVDLAADETVLVRFDDGTGFAHKLIDGVNESASMVFGSEPWVGPAGKEFQVLREDNSGATTLQVTALYREI